MDKMLVAPDYATRRELHEMSAEEHTTRALLLGMEFCRIPGKLGYYRRRDGPSFQGCAYFSYFNPVTLRPIKDLQRRSELDQPFALRKKVLDVDLTTEKGN